MEKETILIGEEHIPMKELISGLLAAVLALTGLGGIPSLSQPEHSGGVAPALSGYTLAQPVYPSFPILPPVPEDGSWDGYYAAQQTYQESVQAIRGDGIPQDTAAGLAAFASRSAPMALSGREGQNTVYSPLSLWSALAMLAQCAEGNSRRQVLDALGTDSIKTLQDQVAQVWTGLYTEDGASSLLLANSIWLNDKMDAHYRQDTLSILAEQYFSSVHSIPMGQSAADQVVTRWISEQTHGLIGSGGPVVLTQADTLAMLVSSLYYRAGWTAAFDPQHTEQDTFTSADGREIKVDFMRRTSLDSFVVESRYQAARLGTSLGEMVFVLPNKEVAPESLLQQEDFLSSLNFSGDRARRGTVRWAVPKFDLNSDLGLMDTLAALGITDLTDAGGADLSSLTTLDAYLSDAQQISRVKVDEEGVEAAAVTILTMMPTSAPIPEPEVCDMNLNRPFLFVIRTEGIPLFVGVVNQL